MIAGTLTKPEILTGEDLLDRLGMVGMHTQYCRLLEMLYTGRDGSVIKREDMLRNLKDPRKHYTFVVVGTQVVATARATLDDGGPDLNALVGDVIAHEDHRRQGYASLAEQALLAQSFARWSNGRSICYVLSNNPEKGNAGFYEANGWRRHNTQLWVKPMLPTG